MTEKHFAFLSCILVKTNEILFPSLNRITTNKIRPLQFVHINLTPVSVKTLGWCAKAMVTGDILNKTTVSPFVFDKCLRSNCLLSALPPADKTS